MGLTIIDPGFLTTVQDEGRKGCMGSGFSPAGALDAFSAALANFLVGNPRSEAVLEMTLRGASMVFDSDARVALAGADMRTLLNGRPVTMNRAYEVTKGDILYTTFAVTGMRCYLAVSGGFDIEEVLGSRSTNLKARLGGFKGRKLESGDTLPFRRENTFPRADAAAGIPVKNKAWDFLCAAGLGTIRGVYPPDDPLVLHVVEGKQARYFTPQGIAAFYSSVYRVLAESDRMGMRLEGTPVASINGTDIVSDGIAAGSVQIPGSGKPIVLLNDRQTTGGYAKIGGVITRDLWRLAQAPAGSAIRFERIGAREAEKIYVRTERALEGLSKILQRNPP